MARFHGGALSDTEEKQWKEQAKADGFDHLWKWIKWVVRQYLYSKK